MTLAVSAVRRLARDLRDHGAKYLWWRYWKARQLPGYGPFPFSRTGHEVHMVTCHRDVAEATWALASWWAASKARGGVILHDDGSLTERDVGTFRTLFPGVKLIQREEADRAVAPRLANLPHCAQYRVRHPLALKLIDCALLGTSEWFTLLDSDLLLFAPVDQAFEAARARWGEGVNIFMEDYQASYSLSQDEMSQVLGKPYRACINTGLALIRRDSIDLTRVETYLRDWPAVAGNLSWTEQTLHALLTEGNAGLLDPSCQVARQAGVAGIVAKHYVGPIRGLLYVEGLELVQRELIRATQGEYVR